jgi:hypothetical protein
MSYYVTLFMCQSSSTIFPGILIFVIFRPRNMQEYNFMFSIELEWTVNSICDHQIPNWCGRISRFEDCGSLSNYITIFLAEGIWKVHIFRHLFVCFQTSVYTLGECRCQLWIGLSQISVLLAPLRVASKTAFVTVKSTIDINNSSNTVLLLLKYTALLQQHIVSTNSYCLSIFNLRLLTTPLVSLNLSCCNWMCTMLCATEFQVCWNDGKWKCNLGVFGWLNYFYC